VDILVWTIAHGEHTAQVAEDGDVSGDAELVALLREKLSEPVTVYRRGTVSSRDGEAPVSIELRPGDGRYVVARIRTLCDGESHFAVAGCDWR
jgi:hypothetical protein